MPTPHQTPPTPATGGGEEAPNPGSAEAKSAGCLCPQQDNNYGQGIWMGEQGRQFIRRLDCPLHGGEEVSTSEGCKSDRLSDEELSRAYDNLRGALINATKQLEIISRLHRLKAKSGLHTTQG